MGIKKSARNIIEYLEIILADKKKYVINGNLNRSVLVLLQSQKI
ncbi:hypothetical protein [Mammaliicoccus sciuri]|nr:hypothetical protein [Mammaliicoccus sciuri]